MTPPVRPNYPLVLFILAIWFVISFVTNIIGPLLPVIIADFRLSLGWAGFLPFSFFLAYGVASIPAGMLIERAGAKPSMLIALATNLVGALLLVLFPSYAVALLALFVIGIGMAMLQVIINPLMRTAGGESHFAFYSVLAQLVFGLASFVSPSVFAALMAHRAEVARGALHVLVPPALPWLLIYWLFAALFVTALALTAAMRMPRVELKDDERAGGWASYAALCHQPKTWLFFAGIAAYVATEQGLANWMSQFLATYHDLSPLSDGAATVGRFWGLMAVGCAMGLGLLKLLDSRLVLCGFTAAAIASVLVALFGDTSMALVGFAAAGFFLSVMFSTVFSLALNSVEQHHGAFSGILCTGIVGGAVSPLVIGQLGDLVGLRAAMLLTVATLAYIFVIGLVARPIIPNATIQRRKPTAA
jgi:fucose permease